VAAGVGVKPAPVYELKFCVKFVTAEVRSSCAFATDAMQSISNKSASDAQRLLLADVAMQNMCPRVCVCGI
jgi:hypothetical protein